MFWEIPVKHFKIIILHLKKYFIGLFKKKFDLIYQENNLRLKF